MKENEMIKPTFRHKKDLYKWCQEQAAKDNRSWTSWLINLIESHKKKVK